ncbi:MAG: CoA pyrophosphatase [Gemmatimonadaceae bacterium]
MPDTPPPRQSGEGENPFSIAPAENMDRRSLEDDHGSSQVPDRRDGRKAAVAVVVRPGDLGDELLVVRRATYPGDPWSGHIALPGGGAESTDGSLEATARRETLEETGIDLFGSDCLCELDTVAPQSIGAPLVSVAPFVFRYRGDKSLRLSTEIVEAWWVSVAEFERADAWSTVPIAIGDGRPLHVRAFQMHGYPLWGLTGRILDEFLAFRHRPGG